MSKVNPLAGLIGCYGDSDDESDEASKVPVTKNDFPIPPVPGCDMTGTIHPAPITHCPWSACYDETSGFTYYWNQQNNAVTWEAPPEYLLALKLAQQQLHTSGSTEVSAEEWQLYQQALAEKQNSKVISKPPVKNKKQEKTTKNVAKGTKRQLKSLSDDDEEKIELITSYHNSDSDSNDEAETTKSPVKPPPTPKPLTSHPPKTPQAPKTPHILKTAHTPKTPHTPKTTKNHHKKQKTKPVEYGPTLPSNLEYSVPIGPEMPPELMKTETTVVNGNEKTPKEDVDDENTLLKRLKDKAKILEKLGGELPSGLEKIIGVETGSGTTTPVKTLDDIKAADIDDLLEEIEKKELPKKTKRIDMFDDESKCSVDSYKNSPKSGISTPVETPKPLFPSSQYIEDKPLPKIETEIDEKVEKVESITEKKENVYLADSTEHIDKTNRKKLRISNSVLPPKKSNVPEYTTKYSTHIDGFSSDRTGLGFSQSDENDKDSPKTTITYGKGLMFTKGETLNEEKTDDNNDDLIDLVEAKLKHLNELQPVVISPVQEMLIQLQALQAALTASSLSSGYLRQWARAAAAALSRHEAAAPPPGWRCLFDRSQARYKYVREADGLEQLEYPLVDTDMDICTTPPPPPTDEQPLPPPVETTLPPPKPPPARAATPPPPAWHDPPPPAWQDPPPPAWVDPPPPGCDEPPPLPPDVPKKQIGDELQSFYEDLAELEKHSSGPNTAASSPDHDRREREKRDKDIKDKERDKIKKKSKVKISTSMGLKHKTVSSMVAKWQQVAEEIHSD